MKDSQRTSQELIRELDSLRGRIAELERLVSEHRRMEAVFREGEKRYRMLIETTSDLIYITDRKGCLAYLNPSLERVLGRRTGEMKGKSFAEILAPEFVDQARDVFKRAMKGESISVYDTELMRKDRRRIAVEFNVTTLLDSDGRPAGRYGIGRDITERKKAQEALRESEEKHRAIIETMQEGYFETDPGGHLLFLNDSMCRILGYGREELTGMNIRRYADDEDIPGMLKAYSRVYETGRPVRNLECRVIRKGGDRKDIDMSISLIRDAEGRPAGLRGIVRDITERRQAVKKLRESQERYRLLVENASDAIFIAQDGVITFPNRKTVEAFGYTEEELARIPYIQHVHPDDRGMVSERYEKRLRGEYVPPTYSFKIVNRFGEELLFQISAAYVDWEGRPATLNCMRDITEQKRLEAQLLQAQKMEAVGTLAGGLAHDFNNLLTGILGNASLAKRELDPDDPNYGRLQAIETIVESGAGLTRQLLALSRGGRVDVRPSDINEVLEKTVALFSRTRKEVTIHQNLDGNLWPVEVDRGQMEQVFMNLFVNAWQAMPGGGELRLETVNTVLTEVDAKYPYIQPGRYVKIGVTDTGKGMDEKTRTRIFEPFFTTREMGRGTGLGLAMVYGIIKGFRGYIHVYSEPGRGTTFTIYLPASEKDVSRETPLSREVLKGTGTILIVDDEEMNTAVCKEILEVLGYTVHTAASGMEALALYAGKKEEIDLVLLDMIMPGMSGGETFDRMKEMNPDARVILCSGYSIDGEAQMIIDRGCDGFIQKPFNLSDLSQKIKDVLNDRQ